MFKLKSTAIDVIGLLFCVCCPNLCYAHESQNPPTNQTSTIYLRTKKATVGNRPKAPSMQQIFCYYEEGQLTFDFAIPEGDCALTVTDLTTNFARSYSFSSEAEATVYVGTLTEAYIEISTASGHEYEGYIGSDF